MKPHFLPIHSNALTGTNFSGRNVEPCCHSTYNLIIVPDVLTELLWVAPQRSVNILHPKCFISHVHMSTSSIFFTSSSFMGTKRAPSSLQGSLPPLSASVMHLDNTVILSSDNKHIQYAFASLYYGRTKRTSNIAIKEISLLELYVS